LHIPHVIIDRKLNGAVYSRLAIDTKFCEYSSTVSNVYMDMAMGERRLVWNIEETKHGNTAILTRTTMLV
jgi:hypothetical protein